MKRMGRERGVDGEGDALEGEISCLCASTPPFIKGSYCEWAADASRFRRIQVVRLSPYAIKK